MRCVNYAICHNRQNSAQRKICWVKYRMCGDCGAIYHPEAYEPFYVKKTLTRIRNIGKRNDELRRMLQ